MFCSRRRIEQIATMTMCNCFYEHRTLERAVSNCPQEVPCISRALTRYINSVLFGLNRFGGNFLWDLRGSAIPASSSQRLWKAATYVKGVEISLHGVLIDTVHTTTVVSGEY
jgi:hypothetical protein